jgi:hypothetical protein
MEKREDQKPGEEQKAKTPKKTRWIILGVIIFLFFAATGYASYRSYFLGPNSKDDIEINFPNEEPSAENLADNPETKTPDTKDAPKSDKSDGQDNSGGSNPGTTPPAASVSFLDFYLDLANSSIGEFEPRNTKRWSRSTIYAAGRPGVILSEYNQCLDMFIADFNNNSGGVRIVHDANQPAMQIRIEMVTMEELREMNGNYLPFADTTNDTLGNMTSAVIYLPNNSDWGNEEKCWSLKHEMMHAVGFMGHSNRLGESEMGNPIMMYWGGLKANDQRSIRMLYQSGVPISSTRDEARAFFSTHSY